MDVGLNNKNALGEIAPEFKDVVFFVEATSTERHNLWQEWSEESRTNIEPLSDDFIKSLPESFKEKVKGINDQVKDFKHTRVNWKDVSAGFMLTIGKVYKRPVCVCFNFAFINGHKICFYESTSRMVDHTMIRDWLISRFQLTNDNYSRWNHTDAMNFHNCVNSLDNIDKEPRDTIYKK